MHWNSSNTFLNKSGFSGRDFLGYFLLLPAMCTAHGTSHIVPLITHHEHLHNGWSALLEREGNPVQGRCFTVNWHIAFSCFLVPLFLKIFLWIGIS